MKKYLIIFNFILMLININCIDNTNNTNTDNDESYPYVERRVTGLNQFQFYFNEALDESTLTLSNFILLNEKNQTMQATIEYDSENYSVLFTPATQLQTGVAYPMRISKNIKSINSNSMQEDYTFLFYETIPDTTPPTVKEEPHTTVAVCWIKFSEPILLKGSNGAYSNIKMFLNNTEIPLPLYFHYDEWAWEVKLRHQSGKFEYSTQYKVLIYDQLQDLNGNFIDLGGVAQKEYFVTTEADLN